ncbi:MAG: hypothetical protein ACT4PM_07785 [Gemmatimonadales bacterium]
MRSKLYAAVIPAVVLIAFPLAAQSSGSESQQGKTAEARIEAAMKAAAQANVPVSLLESKVAEGQAKRVPPDRIAAAVEARLTTLVRASRFMAEAGIEQRTTAELAIAGDALQAGVGDSALVRVYRNAPAERRVVAMAVLSDLVRLGSTSEAAFTRVNATLRSSAALANLQAEVAAQLRLGGLVSTLDAAGGIGIGGTVRIP